VTRRKPPREPSPLLARAVARLAELEASGVREHPGGRAPIRQWITLALDARGPGEEPLEGPEVDEALGGVEPMVDAWELGRLEPTAAQVVLLAELCNMPVGFFYQTDLPPQLGPIFMCSRRKIDGVRCRQVSGEIVSPAEQHLRDQAARRGEPAPDLSPNTQGALF
jgi:hypothetical protein